MTRIMLMANAPWVTSGYGVQTKHLAPRLKAHGHDVACFAFWGLAGGIVQWNGITVYPMGFDSWGTDIIEAHMQHFQADVLLTIMDVCVMDWFSKRAKDGAIRWLPWMPIDQTPAPEISITHSEGAEQRLIYSQFGVRTLQEAGVTNVRYMPLGIDTSTFKPGDKLAARHKLNLPENAFIIGNVGANKGYPSRKTHPEQLVAFSRFHKRHPEALFYIHALADDINEGLSLRKICKSLGIENAVYWTDAYSYVMGWPEERMATLYQAMDLYSGVALGEGFGVPLIEAQACGVPIVTANNSSMPELTFAGELVNGQPFWTKIDSWAMTPNIDEIEAAYEMMYERLHRPTEAVEMSEAAVAGASVFDWDKLTAEYWLPLLEAL